MSKQLTRKQIVNKTADLMCKASDGERKRKLPTSYSPEIDRLHTLYSQNTRRKQDKKRNPKTREKHSSAPPRGTRREKITASGFTQTEELRLQAQEKIRILIWRLGVMSETLFEFQEKMTVLVTHLDTDYRRSS